MSVLRGRRSEVSHRKSEMETRGDTVEFASRPASSDLRPLFTIAAVVLLLVGCNGTDPLSLPHDPRLADAPLPDAPPHQIWLDLNWFPEAEHGGYFAAQVHGYFVEEGLNVRIVPGGPKAPVVAQVASDPWHFGVDNADKLLLGRAQKADVIAVFAPIQDSPRCILVHADAGVDTFDDLARQTDFTLAMNPGQPFAQFLAKKLPLSGLTMVQYPGNISQFLLEKNFGQQAYSFSEPFVAKQQGVATKLLMVSELGFNPYTSALLVHEALAKEQPEVVRKMVRASRRGWQKYLSDPGPTNDFIHDQNPEMSLDVLQFGVTALKPLCLPHELPASTLGQMTPERWETLAAQMVEAGSLSADSVDAFRAFSLEFLTEKPVRK
jgi:NitT/TauT family transport system substrate-binding protein